MGTDLRWASPRRKDLIAGAQKMVKDLDASSEMKRDSIVWFLRYRGPGEAEALQIAAAECANLPKYPRVREIALEWLQDALNQELDDDAAVNLVPLLNNAEMDRFFDEEERISAQCNAWRKRYITSS
jgi:hypothetical protein